MTNSRQIFSELLSSEAGAEARQRFDLDHIRIVCFDKYRTAPHQQPSDVAQGDIYKMIADARDDLNNIRLAFARLSKEISQTSTEKPLRTKAILELAPLFVATQYLLHAVCGNWNNDERYALTTLRIHALDIGHGQPKASRIDRYQELLRDHSVANIGSDLLHTAIDTRISEGAFSFASKLMIVSYFPQSLAGQIIGANLYLRQSGLFPPFELICASDNPTLHFLDLGRSPKDGSFEPAQLSLEAVLEYVKAEDHDKALCDVCAGFNWAREETARVCEMLLSLLIRWIDPREAAYQLVSRRREDALQYHKKTRIDGAVMSDLLKDPDVTKFLERLALSKLVHPSEPQRSPILNGLISPQSKMFRIFSRDDIDVLDCWIRGLPYSTTTPTPPAYELWKDDGRIPLRVGGNVPQPDLRVKPRDMYMRLLQTEASATDNAYAAEYVKRWLNRSARSVADGRCPLPEEWGIGILQRWLQYKHEASNNSAEKEDNIPSREEVVADICSLAPLTMIDGAWLSGFAHPSLASLDSGYSLFETFFDELGNGIYEINHPVIYRELIQIVAGPLPRTSDHDYACSQVFQDEDFELPVFWLSIGRYPETYRPEIMGLNLAMELSGVGGGYRRTNRALAAHGLPTTFVDLHNSIDNISTGHSAWAAASIDAFMSSLPRVERSRIWERVRTGFVALSPPDHQTFLSKIKDKLKWQQ